MTDTLIQTTGAGLAHRPLTENWLAAALRAYSLIVAEIGNARITNIVTYGSARPQLYIESNGAESRRHK